MGNFGLNLVDFEFSLGGKLATLAVLFLHSCDRRRSFNIDIENVFV